MDIFAITKIGTDIADKLIEKYQTSHFVESEMSGEPLDMAYGEMIGKSVPVKKNTIKLSDILSFVLGVIIGLYAAYLSWQCNTKMDYSTFVKVIFAIFAYIFGLVYLILYLIMRFDTCRVISKSKSSKSKQ
jgi:uncharacterized protein YacL